MQVVFNSKISQFIDSKNLKYYFDDLYSAIKKRDTDYWLKTSKEEKLKLFKFVAYNVPAYKDFLKKHKVNPDKIKNYDDLKYVPPINKENYLWYYPYDKLLIKGDEFLKTPLTMHASSGSTGEPTYYFRDILNDLQRAFALDFFLKNNNITTKQPTLFIVNFGMGIWSAGTGMYNSVYLISKINDYPISLISPGVNKIETLKIFKNLGKYFRQIILAGYPPFVKDVIDEIDEYRLLDLKKINMRLILAGETFPEELRDYFNEKLNLGNIFLNTMNAYGTSELGAIAIETPLSILIRRLCHRNKEIFKDMFGEIDKTPTLCQYIPYFVNFDCIDGELYFYGRNAIPLVKYQSGDRGGLKTLNDIKDIFRNYGINLDKEIRQHKIQDYINELPFVYVYERKNLAATFYGILIYPEFIKKILLGKSLNRFFTGRFTVITKYDKRQNQYLEINLELKKNVSLKQEDKVWILKEMVKGLRMNSSEYRELHDHLKERANPKLVFWPYNHPKYFGPISRKHKWVIKQQSQ
jgi:phenylacetate-CoA ligase